MSSILDRSPLPSFRLGHRQLLYQQLCLKLREALWRYDYEAACSVLNLLVLCRETEWDHFWAVAINVLNQVARNKTDCLRFLQISHNRVSALHKEDVLLEIVRYQISSQMYQEAYESIETYITISPYNLNSRLHGYMGVLAIRRWQSKIDEPSGKDFTVAEKDRDEQDGFDDNESSNPQNTHASRWFKNAKDHLLRSLELDMSNDMFLRYYVQLLHSEHKNDEIQDILIRFRDHDPSNLIAHRWVKQALSTKQFTPGITLLCGLFLYRLLFEFLRAERSQSNEWVLSALAYVRLDPKSPRDLVLEPLLSYYEKAIGTSTILSSQPPNLLSSMLDSSRRSDSTGPEQITELGKKMIELLLDRFEHGDDDPWLVDKLTNVLAHFKSIGPAHLNANSTHWFSLYTRFSPRKISPAVCLAFKHLCEGGELVVKDEEGELAKGEEDDLEEEDEESELAVENEEGGE
ncbi:hypothetical protein BC937DRAFT_86673 [Endogone sp. FLAS-F59071]|nr:hypothetical protein BC937DRAFT_86673 [Endogone sp. FLAS-F59071]|eukprot:RUS22813.1 hypothetical protein BC937DRAFT_86673 [Endogone sp. FLAS-F59071]